MTIAQWCMAIENAINEMIDLSRIHRHVNMRPLRSHRRGMPSPDPLNLAIQLGWKHSRIAPCAEYLNGSMKAICKMLIPARFDTTCHPIFILNQDAGGVLHFKFVEMVT